MINFTIVGKPKALQRHRSTRTGIMYDPSKKDKIVLWLKIAKYKPVKPYEGNIYIKCIFYFGRPKSHYRTGKYRHLLKDNFKDIVYHKTKPDIDNCLKIILDVMNKRFFNDDSQVCTMLAEKKYGEPRTEIVIEEII